MSRWFLYILASALLLTSAVADTTVCYGDRDCTIVSGSGSRKMTPSELTSHWREQSRDRLDQIECRHSQDEARCRTLMRDLRSLFNGGGF